jgi:hypothetical protein
MNEPIVHYYRHRRYKRYGGEPEKFQEYCTRNYQVKVPGVIEFASVPANVNCPLCLEFLLPKEELKVAKMIETYERSGIKWQVRKAALETNSISHGGEQSSPTGATAVEETPKQENTSPSLETNTSVQAASVPSESEADEIDDGGYVEDDDGGYF